MGLDACVYCDCVEKGRFKTPHPFPRLLYIAADGRPEIRSKDPAKLQQHDEWSEGSPCKHGLELYSCRLGSSGGIDTIYHLVQGLSAAPHKAYPVLWKKVIYCGSHTGDCLKIPDVIRLRNEISQLRKIDFRKANVSPEDLRYVREFIANQTTLVTVSLRVKKPIAF